MSNATPNALAYASLLVCVVATLTVLVLGAPRGFWRQLVTEPKACHVVALMALSTHGALLVWGAFRHSPTYDEPAHLLAGLRVWTHGDTGLYRVNPPLVHMIAALPAWFGGASVDWGAYEESCRDHTLLRPEFVLGQRFMDANGVGAFSFITYGRLLCIPLSVLGGIVGYKWALELYGERAAVVVVTLWSICPSVLAHGQLVSPDAAATACGLLAFYRLWRWSKTSTWRDSCSAGACLGLAALTKTTWIIGLVLAPALSCGIALASYYARGCRGQRIIGYSLQHCVVVCLALLVINAGYGFNGTGTRLRDFPFASRAMSAVQVAARYCSHTDGVLQFELDRVRVPLPKDLILGLDTQKADIERPRYSYLAGERRERGWWYFYLYGWLVKLPLGMLVLLLISVGSGVSKGGCWNEAYVLVPCVAILLVISSATNFTMHVRYILPALPFATIWLSRICRITVQWLRVGIVACIAFCGASSLWCYPHSLSYFNELVGGPRNGHNYLLDSNIDWGQDLWFLRDYVKRQRLEHIYLLVWTRYDPGMIGLSYELPSLSCPEPDSASHSESSALLPRGTYVLSVNYVHENQFLAPNGAGGYSLVDSSRISEVVRNRKVDMIGYTLRVFVEE